MLQEAALQSLHEEEAPTDPGALSTNHSLVGNAEQLQAVIAIIKRVGIFRDESLFVEGEEQEIRTQDAS